jgi:hypothetical protein
MKNNVTLLKYCLVAVLLPSLSYNCVSAQSMFSTNPFNNPLNNMLNTMITGKVNEEMLRQSVANQNSRSGGSTRSTAPPVATRTKKSAAEISRITSFRPTPTPLKVQELANLLGSTPEDREATFTAFSGLLTYYAGEEKRLGKPNDFALALSVFLAVNSSVYHGTPPPDDAHLLRLRDIIAEAMAEDPQFAAVTDRSKQELYEVMIIYTLFTQGSYEEARKAGRQDIMDGYRKFAGMNLQNFCKVSPERLTF